MFTMEERAGWRPGASSTLAWGCSVPSSTSRCAPALQRHLKWCWEGNNPNSASSNPSWRLTAGGREAEAFMKGDYERQNQQLSWPFSQRLPSAAPLSEENERGVREAWGGRRGGKCEKKRQNTYLTGAPRDWAGFSMTVMVVSVSLRGESVSYSGMDGAAAEQREHVHYAPATAFGSDGNIIFTFLRRNIKILPSVMTRMIKTA